MRNAWVGQAYQCSEPSKVRSSDLHLDQRAARASYNLTVRPVDGRGLMLRTPVRPESSVLGVAVFIEVAFVLTIMCASGCFGRMAAAYRYLSFNCGVLRRTWR